ncbi:hypothetical protein FRC11_009570, partial [Ceratobasidium sp. 423]
MSISSREETTPIAVAIPTHPKSKVSSLDLMESVASLTEPSPTITSLTISNESSLSSSILSDSSITSSLMGTISEISGVSGETMSLMIPLAPTPISFSLPQSPSISLAVTPELTPPSSQPSLESCEEVRLTPSPSVQPDGLLDVSIKSSSPSLLWSPSIHSISSLPKVALMWSAVLSKSPSIRTATGTAETEECSETPVLVPALVKCAQSVSPPPMHASSPSGLESDYFISSPLSQDMFQSLPHVFSSSPPLSEVSIISHGTVQLDSKSLIGITATWAKCL